MYNLLIVEDEDYIRETIVNCLDWQRLGFRVEQAEDGEVALEIVQRFRPDAVVTDIRMPFMDGLELTSRLRTLLPETVVVILSGHDEFGYAQQAMSLGVLEYITKPILPQDFTQAMQRLHSQIRQRKEQSKLLDKLQLQLYQSLPLLRERLLNQIISVSMDRQIAQEKLHFLDLSLGGEAFVMLLFSAFEGQGTFRQDSELIPFALLNVVAEEIGDHGLCFNDAQGRLAVLYGIRDTQHEDRKFLLELATSLRLSNQYILDFTITCAVGEVVATLEELPYSYETASVALEQQFLQGRDKTFDCQDYIGTEPESFYFLSQVERLTSNFHFQSQDVILSQVDQLFDSMMESEKTVHPDSIRVALVELLNGVHKVLVKAGCQLPQDSLPIYELVLGMHTLEDAIPLLQGYLQRSKQALNEMDSPRSALLIQQACDYIANNFENPDLSLNTVAKQVFVTPVYLSTLFRREIGVTFIDYVTQTRLEKAKQYLKARRHKNYEVAQKVGYNDPQYFSNCFKKYTGMSPSDYRRQCR